MAHATPDSQTHAEPATAAETPMEDPSTAKPIETERAEGLEKYMLHGRRQITQLLQALIDERCLIAAHTGGNQSFVTALLRLDDEGVLLDASPDAASNRRALLADRLLCVSHLHRIRIQFSLRGLTEVMENGRPALRAGLPEQVLRLQRREFYRLQVPLKHELSVSLDARNAAGEPVRVDSRVLDISAGGLATVVAPHLAAFVIGERLEDCRLRLPDTDPLQIGLEVRNITHQPQRNGSELLRIGLRFAELPRDAELRIQRYILRTERELNAKEKGGF